MKKVLFAFFFLFIVIPGYAIGNNPSSKATELYVDIGKTVRDTLQ
jgi:hypothetical protein